MAVTTANVYRFSITQKSLFNPPGTFPINAGYGNGTSEQIVVSQTPALAIAVLMASSLASDIANYQGPVLVAAGALLSGTAALAEAPPAPPVEEPPVHHQTKHAAPAEEPHNKHTSKAAAHR
jgi:hypothetical protein